MQDQNEQLDLPYWQRESYKPYLQIKQLQPKLDSTISEYVKTKLEDQETRLL